MFQLEMIPTRKKIKVKFRIIFDHLNLLLRHPVCPGLNYKGTKMAVQGQIVEPAVCFGDLEARESDSLFKTEAKQHHDLTGNCFNMYEPNFNFLHWPMTT